MKTADIAQQRLHNQHLVAPLLGKPQDVVAHLGAVQSQDFIGAKWAVGQRTKNASDAAVQKAFDDGKILRTHMLRPTWHFVTPEDIKWVQALTAPRVHAFNKYYYKKLGLDDTTFKKADEALIKALQGSKQLTRTEVNAVYKAAKIDASGLRLAYLIMHAELDALICSGAMQGKQHTYALVAERAPHAKTKGDDEALAELTTRFFTNHGPAQAQDFAWWSSLTVAEVKKGLELAKNHLHSETIDGKTFWFAHNAPVKIADPTIHLLPNYDESLIAYKDRTASFDQSLLTRRAAGGVFDVHFIVLNGYVIGGWKRAFSKTAVTIKTTLLADLNAKQQAALKTAAKSYGDFLGLEPVLQ